MRWLVTSKLTLGLWIFIGLFVVASLLINPISQWFFIKIGTVGWINFLSVCPFAILDCFWMSRIIENHKSSKNIIYKTRVTDIILFRTLARSIPYFIAPILIVTIIYFSPKANGTSRIILLISGLFVISYFLIFSFLSFYESKNSSN
jgi:hypothetical protein